MVRQLKHHEKKLLKKTDLYTYKSDQGHRAGEIQRRYGVSDVEYNTYNAICGSLRKMAHKLSQLEPEDPTRRKLETAMLEKLYSIGVIEKNREQGGALSQVEHITVSAFCRRRLPIVMIREQKMIQYVDKAIEAVAQGHVRVGTQVVQDPATLVTRNMVDFVQWVPNSKFRVAGQNYHGKRDDFDTLQL